MTHYDQTRACGWVGVPPQLEHFGTYDISSGGGIHPQLDDPLPPQLQMRPGGVPPNAFRA